VVQKLSDITKEDLLKLTAEELVVLEKEIERERVRYDLLYLCREYLGFEDLDDDLHGEVADELDDIEKTTREGLFLLPRGHLKSSVISVAKTIQYILRNPNVQIAIISATASKANDVLQEVKFHLLSTKLVELFPEILWEDPRKASVWREDVIAVKRTRPGVSVKTYGIDGEITGAHFDVMIYDDMQSGKNSTTALQIDKVLQAYRNGRSILEPGGIRLIVGTRWKREDVYQWMIDHNYRYMLRNATRNKFTKEPCHIDDPDAEPIFPEKFTIELLRQTRFEQGSYFYSLQYENEPLNKEDIVFKAEWFKTYTDDTEYKKINVLIDPAITMSEKADETVVVMVGEPMDENKPMHVIQSRGYKADITGLIDIIFSSYLRASRMAKEVLLGIEVAAFQKALKQWVESEQNKRKIWFPVTELKPGNRPKDVRIRNLQPLIERGGLVFKDGETDKLILQLVDFGASVHDDHPDALAYILDVVEVSTEVYEVVNYLYGTTSHYDPNSLEAQLEQMELEVYRIGG
jgi:hypothetical protein